MGAPEIVLRPASSADAEFLAWGLDEAAGGFFQTLFGRRWRTILTTVMAQPAHAFSFQHVVIAESAGVPVGMCQGFPPGTPSGLTELSRAAGLAMLRASTIALAGWPVMSALSTHGSDEWYLQAIAVKPEARGLGVGGLLFADAFARAGNAECSDLVLDVEMANVRARALYERLGLHVVSTSHKAVLLGGVRVQRMAGPVSK